MKRLIAAERFSLTGHILSLVFGWAGLLLVLPNPEFIASLSETGQQVFQWSMAGGGVVYMILGAIALGSLLLTFWDFVLDPAMSQLDVPFWIWDQPGAFFGMPYQNFIGWFGTGVVFMTVATLLWKKAPIAMPRTRLGLPLAIYLSNIIFGAVLSLAGGYVIPVILGGLLGIVPALILYALARPTRQEIAENLEKAALSEVEETPLPVSSFSAISK